MNDPNYKQTFHIQAGKDNPEFTNDFNTAVKKLLLKMTKEGSPDSQELLKILVQDKTKLQSDIDKLDIVKRPHIENKVNGYLAKKEKNLETIKNKLNNEHMLKTYF